MINLYKNIKRYRTELGMSQDELAKKTGYKSRTSIAKIEAGLVDLPQSKIELFSKALDVSPGVLMGKISDYEFRDVPPNMHSSFANLDDFKKAYDKSKYRRDRLISAIIDNSEKLNNKGRKNLLDYSNVLLGNPSFIQEIEVNAAHPRTDIDVSDNNDTSDNDIMDNDDEWK